MKKFIVLNDYNEISEVCSTKEKAQEFAMSFAIDDPTSTIYIAEIIEVVRLKAYTETYTELDT